jgi:hypothetical protein
MYTDLFHRGSPGWLFPLPAWKWLAGLESLSVPDNILEQSENRADPLWCSE